MVFECIEALERYRREQANVEGRVHAIGWTGLFNGFKKETDPNMDFVDLLPFPDDIKDNSRKISPATESIIKDIIKNNRLPPAILSALNLLLS